MLDIIRMDLLKMRKMMSFIIIMVIFVFIMLLNNVMAYSAHEMDKESSSVEYVENHGIAGLTAEEIKAEMEEALRVDPYEEFANGVKDLMPALMIMIFIVLFTNADMSSGFIKTIGGQVKRRSQLIISKHIVMLVYTVLFLAVSFAVNTVMCLIFFGDDVHFSSLKTFLIFMLVQLFMYYSLVTFCSMITTLFRSNMVGMIISLLTVMQFFDLFLNLLSGLIKNSFDIKILLTDYVITTCITNYCLGDSITSKPLIICGVTLVISLVISLVTFEKRDII